MASSRSVTFYPIYYIYNEGQVAGSEGYTFLFNRNHFPDSTVIGPIVGESRLGSFRPPFTEAYGLVSTGKPVTRIAFVRYRHASIYRTDAITRTLWVAGWDQFKGVRFELGQVFRAMSGAQNEQTVDPSRIEPILLELSVADPSQELDLPELLERFPLPVIDVVASLMSGRRYTVIGLNALDAQLSMIEAISYLLPVSLQRDLTFVTSAFDPDSTTVRLVFSPRSSARRLGVILINLDEARFEIYDRDDGSPRGEHFEVNWYCNTLRYYYEKGQLAQFHAQIAAIELPEVACLDQPDTYFPALEDQIGIALFRKRLRSGELDLQAEVEGLERWGDRLEPEDVKSAAQRVLSGIVNGQVPVDRTNLVQKLVLHKNIERVEIAEHIRRRVETYRPNSNILRALLVFLIDLRPLPEVDLYRRPLSAMATSYFIQLLNLRPDQAYEQLRLTAGLVDMSAVQDSISQRVVEFPVGIKGSQPTQQGWPWEEWLRLWAEKLQSDRQQQIPDTEGLEEAFLAIVGGVVAGLALTAPGDVIPTWLGWCREGVLNPQQALAVCPLNNERVVQAVVTGLTRVELDRQVIFLLWPPYITEWGPARPDLPQATERFWQATGHYEACRQMLGILATQRMPTEPHGGLFSRLFDEFENTADWRATNSVRHLYVKLCQWVSEKPDLVKLLDSAALNRISQMVPGLRADRNETDQKRRQTSTGILDGIQDLVVKAAQNEAIVDLSTLMALRELAASLGLAVPFLTSVIRVRELMPRESIPEQLGTWFRDRSGQRRYPNNTVQLVRLLMEQSSEIRNVSETDKCAIAATLLNAWPIPTLTAPSSVPKDVLQLAISWLPASPDAVDQESHRRLAKSLWGSTASLPASNLEVLRVGWLSQLLNTKSPLLGQHTAARSSFYIVQLNRFTDYDLDAIEVYRLEYKKALANLVAIGDWPSSYAGGKELISGLGELTHLPHITRRQLYAYMENKPDLIVAMLPQLLANLMTALDWLWHWFPHIQAGSPPLETIPSNQFPAVIALCDSILDQLGKSEQKKFLGAIVRRRPLLQTQVQNLANAFGNVGSKRDRPSLPHNVLADSSIGRAQMMNILLELEEAVSLISLGDMTTHTSKETLGALPADVRQEMGVACELIQLKTETKVRLSQRSRHSVGLLEGSIVVIRNECQRALQGDRRYE